MASTKKRKSTNSKKSTKNTKDNKQNFMRDEITILVSLAVCIFAMISHFGIGGFIGDALSAFLFGVFGFMAYIVPIFVLHLFYRTRVTNKLISKRFPVWLYS